MPKMAKNGVKKGVPNPGPHIWSYLSDIPHINGPENGPKNGQKRGKKRSKSGKNGILGESGIKLVQLKFKMN